MIRFVLLKNLFNILTIATESRAATAKISAHDTTPGQEFSTEVLMLSTTSKPLAELLFGAANFSLWVMFPPWSNKIEASHPYNTKKGNTYLYIIRMRKLSQHKI